MPPRFGSIAKVFCTTGGANQTTSQINELQELKSLLTIFFDKFKNIENVSDLQSINFNDANLLNYFSGPSTMPTDEDFAYYTNIIENVIRADEESTDLSQYNPTTDLYVLSYNTEEKLMLSPDLVKTNIKNYLSQFRMLTDKIRIIDGFIINFGVFFNVMAFPGFDKTIIKNNCINAITEFYHIKNMNFKQVLYTADIVSILNSIEGVKAVNDVIFTQSTNFNEEGVKFDTPKYSKSFNEQGESININDLGYGYLYDFQQFFNTDSIAGRGVVLPAKDPSVFEIKNPRTDIKGVVK